MKLKQIFKTKPVTPKKIKESADHDEMTVAEIESTLDDIQNEYGDDATITKAIAQVTKQLVKKDVSAASKSMTSLMNKIRQMNND